MSHFDRPHPTRRHLLAVTLSLLPLLASAQKASPHRVEKDLVTRSETAIAIARAIGNEVYGADSIDSQLPLTARQEGAVWHVRGHLPPGIPGGVIEVWISRRDGKVVRLTHGK